MKTIDASLPVRKMKECITYITVIYVLSIMYVLYISLHLLNTMQTVVYSCYIFLLHYIGNVNKPKDHNVLMQFAYTLKVMRNSKLKCFPTIVGTKIHSGSSDDGSSPSSPDVYTSKLSSLRLTSESFNVAMVVVAEVSRIRKLMT